MSFVWKDAYFFYAVFIALFIFFAYNYFTFVLEYENKCRIDFGQEKYYWRPELTAELRANESACLRVCHSPDSSFAYYSPIT